MSVSGQTARRRSLNFSTDGTVDKLKKMGFVTIIVTNQPDVILKPRADGS